MTITLKEFNNLNDTIKNKAPKSSALEANKIFQEKFKNQFGYKHYLQLEFSRIDSNDYRRISDNYRNIVEIKECVLFPLVKMHNSKYANLYLNSLEEATEINEIGFLYYTESQGFEEFAKQTIKINQKTIHFLFDERESYSPTNFYSPNEKLLKKFKKVKKFIKKMEVFEKTTDYFLIKKISGGEIECNFLKNGAVNIEVKASLDIHTMTINSVVSSNANSKSFNTSISDFWEVVKYISEDLVEESFLNSLINPPVEILIGKIKEVIEREKAALFVPVDELTELVKEHLDVATLLNNLNAVNIEVKYHYMCGNILLVEDKVFVFPESKGNIVVLEKSEINDSSYEEKIILQLLKVHLPEIQKRLSGIQNLI